MKYIRTKDNFIYRITTRDFGIFVIDEKGNLIGRIDADEIIKQADTIEELCDFIFEFDEKNKINNIVDLRNNKLAKEFDFKLWLKKNSKYAIETDKGLIYVAKINEKGELELL